MKIAFLFLTLGDLNHENLWIDYFKGNENKYNIYCHPKNNINSKWLMKYVIKNNVKTSWGKTVNAILELLKEGIKDKDNKYFVLVSESCVPIKSFNKFYTFLNNNEKSFVKKFNITTYDKESRLNKVKNSDKYNLIKHYANWCLNRHHVKKLLVKENELKDFSDVDSQDEFFLSVLNNDFIDYEIVNVDWDYTKNLREMIKNFKTNNNELDKAKKLLLNEITKHPRTYYKLDYKIINNLINSESFFARKFNTESNVLEFKNQLLAS
jgi:hypothetical protein